MCQKQKHFTQEPKTLYLEIIELDHFGQLIIQQETLGTYYVLNDFGQNSGPPTTMNDNTKAYVIEIIMEDIAQ